MATKKATRTSRVNWCIVGNGPYGLWFGVVRATDAEVAKTHALRLYQARNIRYWYGRKGGITSLAAYGPCGPRVAESKIGAPVESALLLDVKSVIVCSPEAVAAFGAVRSHD
jgi:hypothetical protein